VWIGYDGRGRSDAASFLILIVISALAALFNGRVAGHPEPRFLVVALRPECRLRGGRFDRLPPLESLFFCWPKRKVTQRKWPDNARSIVLG
jgi:hypothetical protein